MSNDFEKSVVGIQLTPGGKVYNFLLAKNIILEAGSRVIVNTSRGKQLGTVKTVDIPVPQNYSEMQTVDRLATPEDLLFKQSIATKEEESVAKVSQFLHASKYVNVKAVRAEYTFDLARLALLLNYEQDNSFDMRAFLRDIAPLFPDTRVEIRQVGPRDSAKLIGGLGACGIEKRCCSSFLNEFNSISIKMAKSQDISLTPGEITGICGRLRCCLAYEHENYEEARKNLPKRKKMVVTPLGEGKVIQVLPMSETVIVEIPDMGPRKFTREELETGVMAQKVDPTEKLNAYELDPNDRDVEIVPLAKRPARPMPDRKPVSREAGPREPREGNLQNKRDVPSGRPNRAAGNTKIDRTGGEPNKTSAGRNQRAELRNNRSGEGDRRENPSEKRRSESKPWQKERNANKEQNRKTDNYQNPKSKPKTGKPQEIGPRKERVFVKRNPAPKPQPENNEYDQE